MVGICSQFSFERERYESAFKAKLLASAVAALFAAVSYSAMADEPVKAGNKKVDAQGRAIDEVKRWQEG